MNRMNHRTLGLSMVLLAMGGSQAMFQPIEPRGYQSPSAGGHGHEEKRQRNKQQRLARNKRRG